MQLDLAVTLPHYQNHLDPIFEALGRPGVVTQPWRARGHALVGSWADADQCGIRKFYVEHGAGQTYDKVPAWAANYYSGSRGHRRVVGFICPSERVADRWRRAYDGLVPTAAVGCPKLDRYVGYVPPGPPTVALTFHWECRICPETLPALNHYSKDLPALVRWWQSKGFTVLGHGHPKDETAERRWKLLGVEYAASEFEVFERAHILVGDNTSLLPEFMALDRNVVFLNAPWYQTEHGGRFWEWTSGGRMANNSDELAAIDLWELLEADTLRVERTAVADSVYAYRDGSSSRRAAEFIIETMEAK